MRTLTAYTFGPFPRRTKVTLPSDEARELLSRWISSGEFDWIETEEA
jgi:hypothetical protein